MKKYVFGFIFLLFLGAPFSLLSMDQLENYIKNAVAAENQGKEDEALKWYGKAAETIIPPQGSLIEVDEYAKERKFMLQGWHKINSKAIPLRARGKYKELIKLYGYAPNRFKDEILQTQLTLERLRKFYEETMKTTPVENLFYVMSQEKDLEAQKNLEAINVMLSKSKEVKESPKDEKILIQVLQNFANKLRKILIKLI